MNDSELIVALRNMPYSMDDDLIRKVADRLAERSEQLTEAIAFWEQHRAVVVEVRVALDQYDKDPHPADPHVLFAFVEAVARAVRH